MSSINLNPEVETASSNAAHQRPKTRQRIHKAPPALPVPDINDDSAERKRVLNVLAQRRYRTYVPLDNVESLVFRLY